MSAEAASAQRAERGISLVEATIVLMVLASLTAVIAPSMGDYIEDGRHVKAKKDLEVIGSAMTQIMHDTGLPCLSLAGGVPSTACNIANKVELLVSGAVVGSNEPTVVTAAAAVAAATASAATLNWGGGANEVADASRDIMDDQFATNTPAYPAVSFTGGGGPRTGNGWRGAYLNAPIDVDPWGYSYQASTVFLGVAFNADDTGAGTGAGQKRGGWTNNVVVLSAGSNGVIQTAFGSSATAAVGDDVVYVVQGATH